MPARMAMVVGLGLAIFAGYGAARIFACSTDARRARRRLLCRADSVRVGVEYRSVPLLRKID